MGRPRKTQITVHVVEYRRAFLQMRYVDPVTRKQVVRSTGTRDRDQALKLAGAWEKELRQRGPVDVSPDSWATFRGEYEAEHVASLKDGSALKIDGVLNAVERLLNPSKITDLTASAISELQARLRGEGLEESTIAGHIRHLKAALRWAHDLGKIQTLPKFPKTRRAKTGSKARVMKGRPLARKEVVAMLRAVPRVVGQRHAAAWRRLINGLHLSGLRLEEALWLCWDRHDCLHVDLSGDHPVFRVYGEQEKGGADRYLPMSPEFARFLKRTPTGQRTGLVFPLPKRRNDAATEGEPLQKLWVSKTISRIGETAGIVVDARSGKYASAHDLRRTFGDRWAPKVVPQVLMQLMRHESIETTLRYYALLDARSVAKLLADGENLAGFK